MKKIIKLFLFLGLLPFLCSLTNEQKFDIVKVLVYGVNMPPIQNLQCDGYDLKSFDGFYSSPNGEVYTSVCEGDHDCFIKDDDGRDIGLNPKCDDKFMYSSIEASRHDTIFDVYIFYKGTRYYVVVNPSGVRKEKKYYTIGDIHIPLDDSIRCDSCLTVFLDKNVPFRIDTFRYMMPSITQTHILSQRKVLRICESEMYEKMSPDSFPAKKCWGVFDDPEVDDIYVDYVNTRPEFAGGRKALVSYWKKKLSTKLNLEEGSYSIVFLVDSEGVVKSPRIRGKDTEHLTESQIELLHHVENMPRWEPGKCERRSVQTKETLCLEIGKHGEVISVSY